MAEPQEYVLGQSANAARRLEIQDAHFAEVSEQLLDDLRLQPGDRVVELGCGAGCVNRWFFRAHYSNPLEASQRSASSAAMQPVPAAVTA
jgi:cyclopropane fatty-acyl-phospholipid synthase-like methyltransferase